MRSPFYIGIFITLLMAGCDQNEQGWPEIKDWTSREKDEEIMAELLDEIMALSEQAACADADNWFWTAYGSKACGGPVGYIPYSQDIDTAYFLDLVNHHAEQQDRFNNKWGIFSTCDVPVQPSWIYCEDGNPCFGYYYNQ